MQKLSKSYPKLRQILSYRQKVWQTLCKSSAKFLQKFCKISAKIVKKLCKSGAKAKQKLGKSYRLPVLPVRLPLSILAHFAHFAQNFCISFPLNNMGYSCKSFGKVMQKFSRSSAKVQQKLGKN